MSKVSLYVNMLLEYRFEDGKKLTERILWIDHQGNSCVTIDINRKNKHALPTWKTYEEIESALETGNASITTTDPWAVLLLPNYELSEERRKMRQDRRDRAWEAIKPLVQENNDRLFDPRQRGPLITAQAKGKKKQEKNDLGENKQEDEQGKKEERKGFIYDALRRYWQGGQTKNALLPFYDECGVKEGEQREGKGKKLGRPSAIARREETPAGVILTDDVRSKLLRGYKEFYVSGKEKMLSKAHQRTLERYFSIRVDERDGPNGKVDVPILLPANQLPSFIQFRYIHQKYDDLTRVLTSREGERRFVLRHRAVLGESTSMAWGPGSLYQGDSTIGDIHLVSSRDRSRLIGRPVIYVIIDVFTRLIVGFSVSLEGPSWLGMMLALYNATVDKVAYCKEYGIDITQDMWPSDRLPEAILGDRGELEGYNSTILVDRLDIDIATTAPYRCDWKGIVEQNFRLINDEVIHWKPGAVYTKRERGDKDYRLEACLTLPEFRKLIVHCIIKHNNHHRMNWYNMDECMISDHVEPYPIDLWNWGMTHRNGHLRDKSPEVIKFNLLPRDTATVTEYGIYFQGVYYTCERAVKEQWYVKARKKRWSVCVAHDPRLLDIIYLDQQGKPEVCTLVEREQAKYQGRDWFEILDYFELQKQAEEVSRTRHYQTEAEFNAEVDHIVQNAQEKTKQATKGQSNAARLKNVRDNRQNERADERASDAWRLREGETSTPPSDTATQAGDSKEAESSSYVPPDQSLDDIRRLRQEKWTKAQERREKTSG